VSARAARPMPPRLWRMYPTELPSRIYSDIGMINHSRDLISVPEAAQMLGLSDRRIRALAAAGSLTATRVGPRMWVLERAEVERFGRLDRPRGRPRKSVT
jgi:excisionase family DNA binding protein